MKTLFHHAYDVKIEDGRYRPVRFSDEQLAADYIIPSALDRSVAQVVADAVASCVGDGAASDGR